MSEETERLNNTIGELLGAEPMRQVWVMWHWPFTTVEGEAKVSISNLGSLRVTLAEAEEWLAEAKKSARKWKSRFPKAPTFEQREQVRVIEQVWHIRYSDTPGGGWDVIEHMRAAGLVLSIESTADGWKVQFDDGNPHHGRVSEVAPTMAEAACKVALRWKGVL